MKSTFKIWKTNRNLILDYFESYTLEQLNTIPDGLSNNLIWNIGHIMVCQQVLIYKSSNLHGYLSAELMERYKPGTKPTGKSSEKEVKELKKLLISLIEKTESDFYNNQFKVYNERTTSMGFHLGTLKETLEYNNYHEALHLGIMMNIRKFL
ncbi:DinB family protein [Flavobacterium sp. NG2]|uniref:DinB family protein n=1 Tax=Flavobacterium sp. NG2 TaxID=3097547 RepID=UPI002A7FF2F1|nr:DinB family protein [Flavobacterium sp. NG2]WPR70866.1 DinB family protein [Flavobacterium sp. NG2]